MKRLAILLIIVGLCMAFDVSRVAIPREGKRTNSIQRAPEYFPGRVIISAIGDSRSLIGPQGKNIIVAPDGQTIGIMYGSPSDPFDANQPFGAVGVAYSTDMGANWSLYEPHNITSPLRRMYCGIDGYGDFHTQAGNVFFAWQEGQLGYDPCLDYAMIDENIPSSPSFSSPVLLAPDAYDIDGWHVGTSVNPEDNMHVMVSAWSYLTNGNSADYCWVSTDGGYSWSDSIRMTPVIDPSCYDGAGHFRFGSGDYVFFTYHDTYQSSPQYPYYVESTDGGYTWSAPAQLPAISSTQFWWTEIDCEVINDLPYAIHNDLDGVLQIFFPDPDDPGSIGAWNWTAVNVDAVGGGAFAYQGTTYTVTPIQYSSVTYEPDLDVILYTYKCGFEIAPPPAGWTDGNYLGGLLSIDGGRNWYATRPLSGPLLQAAGGGVESAHRLATYPSVPGTTYVYTTWEDAGDGVIGNQYFELGMVQTIDASIFGPGYDPGVAENDDVGAVSGIGLKIAPTVVNDGCRVTFNMAKPGHVNLKVYDATGRLVNTAFNGYLDKGDHFINMSTSNLANGVYIVSVESSSGIDVGKVIINH